MIGKSKSLASGYKIDPGKVIGKAFQFTKKLIRHGEIENISATSTCVFFSHQSHSGARQLLVETTFDCCTRTALRYLLQKHMDQDEGKLPEKEKVEFPNIAILLNKQYVQSYLATSIKEEVITANNMEL
ncbi:hypothetical protein V6N13_073953 [Hibiscus sabdariffa]|uniref:Uncharacterized protein n=1 Tax=Hibiscus sabdariffa TaxID=183260 RepID=A0ABR2U7P0_9ROSI